MERARRIRSMLFTCAVLLALSLTALADAREFTASSKGSVFLVPNIELRWNAQGDLVQDTFVHLHNDFPGSVRVFMFFVNGDPALPANGNERAHPGWNRIDFEIEMTANQPLYWSTSTGMGAPSPAIPPFILLDLGSPSGRPDPEGSDDRVLRGFLVGWAVNVDTEEISWNHLSATATVVDYRAGGAWGYNGYHAQAVDPAILLGEQTGTPGVLNFDGVEFSQTYDRLLFNFAADGSDLYSDSGVSITANSDITLMPVSNDLQQDSVGPIVTDAKYTVFNENEVQFSGMHRCVSCWDQTLAALYDVPNHFPIVNLQTDAGWAEVDGLSSQLCADLPGVLTDASLVGLVSRRIFFNNSEDTDYAGFNMLGRGGETARIFYDVPDGPPERSADDSGPADDPQQTKAQLAAKLAALTNKLPGDSHGALPGRGITSDPRVSSSKPGNLVYISKVDLRWDTQGVLRRDTFIHLTNWYSQPVKVRMYFINGDDAIAGDPPEPGWNSLEVEVDLTARQPIYWSAFSGNDELGIPSWIDLDPGSPPGRPDPEFGGTMLRGFIVAWAVDDNCQEIAGNVLMADAILVDNGFYNTAWGYNAYHLPNIADVPFGTPSGTPGVLELNGIEYPSAFNQLSFIAPAHDSEAYSVGQAVVFTAPDVTLHHVSGDFTPNSPGPFKTKANYDIWNQNETRFTGMYRCVTCWDETFLFYYDAPTHFVVSLLQTQVGAARIDGLASQLCDDPGPTSVDAPLLGVLGTFMAIDFGNTDYAWAGHNMFGQGTEDAFVRGNLCVAPCPWDIATNAGPGSDGVVNLFDLLLLLDNWGTANAGADIAPPVNIVNLFDLLNMIDHWGPCP